MIGWVFYIRIGTVIVRVYIIVLYNTMRHEQRQVEVEVEAAASNPNHGPSTFPCLS